LRSSPHHPDRRLPVLDVRTFPVGLDPDELLGGAGDAISFLVALASGPLVAPVSPYEHLVVERFAASSTDLLNLRLVVPPDVGVAVDRLVLHLLHEAPALLRVLEFLQPLEVVRRRDNAAVLGDAQVEEKVEQGGEDVAAVPAVGVGDLPLGEARDLLLVDLAEELLAVDRVVVVVVKEEEVRVGVVAVLVDKAEDESARISRTPDSPPVIVG